MTGLELVPPVVLLAAVLLGLGLGLGLFLVGAVGNRRARARVAARGAAVEGAASPIGEHRHAWELRSTEETNRRRREVYVCAACQDREIREVDRS